MLYSLPDLPLLLTQMQAMRKHACCQASVKLRILVISCGVVLLLDWQCHVQASSSRVPRAKCMPTTSRCPSCCTRPLAWAARVVPVRCAALCHFVDCSCSRCNLHCTCLLPWHGHAVLLGCQNAGGPACSQGWMLVMALLSSLASVPSMRSCRRLV